MDLQVLTDLWNWVVTNWLGIVVGTIVTLITSYIFFIKSIKTLKPCYSSHSTNVINEKASKIDRLKIYYSENGKAPTPNDKTLENFTISYIPFWNHGDNAIRNADVSPNKPIILKIKDGYRLLDVIKLKETSDNGFTVTKIDDNSYNISFIYLNKGQGALLKVFHDGKSNNDISIIGDLIDCKGIKKVEWDGIIKDKKPKSELTLKGVISGVLFLVSVLAIYIALMWVLLTIFNPIFSTINGLSSHISNNSTTVSDILTPPNSITASIYYGIISTVLLVIIVIIVFGYEFIKKWNTPQIPEELTVLEAEK